MSLTKTLALGTVAAVLAVLPVSGSPSTPAEMAQGKLFRLEVTCAAAQEAFDQVGDEFASNSGCEPAPAYVCTTPRADYLDKRPI